MNEIVEERAHPTHHSKSKKQKKPVIIEQPKKVFIQTQKVEPKGPKQIVSCCLKGEVVLWEDGEVVEVYQIGWTVEKCQILQDTVYVIGQYQMLTAVNIKVNIVYQD